jgi:hypothetical protein
LPNRATLAVALPEMSGQPAMAITVGARKATMLSKQDQFMAELTAACRNLARTSDRSSSG